MKRSEEQLKKQGKLLFVGMGLLVLTVFIYKATNKKEEINRITNCPRDIKRETVIVLDKSSILSTQTQDAISARIEKILKDRVQVGERVTFYEVNDEAYTNLHPIAVTESGKEFCKPKVTAENGLTENSDLIEARYLNTVKKLLASEKLKGPSKESKSPIAQVVHDVALSKYMFVDQKFDKSKKISFYLFSDLMENSRDLSMYGCKSGKVAIDTFTKNKTGQRTISSEKDTGVRPVFNNISNFKVYEIPSNHPHNAINDCKENFWKWYMGIIHFSDEVPQEERKWEKPDKLPG